MKTINRFYCADCGDENLRFPAWMIYRPTTGEFEPETVNIKRAHCENCAVAVAVIQSTETIFEPKPETGKPFNPITQTGNL